jgi:hypothetical protein
MTNWRLILVRSMKFETAAPMKSIVAFFVGLSTVVAANSGDDKPDRGSQCDFSLATGRVRLKESRVLALSKWGRWLHRLVRSLSVSNGCDYRPGTPCRGVQVQTSQ